MISRISYAELQDIKNRLKNSHCVLCESNELAIEMPEDRIRSIFPSNGEPAFNGFIIGCGNCENSSYYDLERDCFGDGIVGPKHPPCEKQNNTDTERDHTMNEQGFVYRRTQEKIQEILSECAGGKYIFRGEDSEYEKVSSKLYREYEKACLVDDHMLESERITVDAARRYVRPDASYLEVLTELQHYGGKTTLIDFTRNLYIALFFACDRHPDKPGRIILFDMTGMKVGEQIETGKAVGGNACEILCPLGKNPRAVFQSSVFVRAPKGYIEKDRLKEIRIEESLKGEILFYLEHHHYIKRDTIYNDLHGFIKNREDNYVQQPYYDRKIKDNKSAEAYFARGTARFASGHQREAIGDFDEALMLDPRHFQALHQRGMTKVVLGDRSGIEDYRRALEIRHNPVTLDSLRCALDLPEDHWGGNGS